MTDTPIYLSDFRSFVFEEIPFYFEETTRGGEIAFEYDLGSGYSAFILTSIEEDSTVVREDDAIRVFVTDDSDELVDMKPHTKRTEGFEQRVIEKVYDYIRCPVCEESIKVANGEYGSYYFCTSQECDFTESV